MKVTVSRSCDSSSADYINLNVERNGILQVITLSTLEEVEEIEKILVYARAMIEKKLV